jgi:hypothetical protein
VETAPGTDLTGGWVDPTAGLDEVEKRKFLTLPRLELGPLRRPVRSQSLYLLCYPGSQHMRVYENKMLRIFGHRKNNIIWKWRKLYNHEIYKLYFLPNTVKVNIRLDGIHHKICLTKIKEREH